MISMMYVLNIMSLYALYWPCSPRPAFPAGPSVSVVLLEILQKSHFRSLKYFDNVYYALMYLGMYVDLALNVNYEKRL
jgi:hypothetical protein